MKTFEDYVIDNLDVESQLVSIMSDFAHTHFHDMSELERIFWFSFSMFIRSPFGDDWRAFFYRQYLKDTKTEIAEIRLRYQQKCGKYKIDFAIIRNFIKIAIELDGFAFHDRDKKQFQYERQRQNYLISKGFTILRYTWHDITKRFDDVYCEILGVIENKLKESHTNG